MLDNSHKRKSLGRGLGALFGDDIDFENKSLEKKVKIENLCASAFQPRLDFDEEALEALAQSIREKGILQPLLVREKINGKYEIIAGERRFRAASMVGLTEVPVIIKKLEDKEVLEVALIENLLRENLSAIEEAEGLQKLINEFSHTQEALAQVIGKSRSHIANTLRLLTLPASVQNLVQKGTLTAGQVRPIIGLENAEELAQKIVEKGLNARQVEELVAKTKKTAKKRINEKTINQDLEEIASFISQNLKVKVKITSDHKGGGKIVLQYDSVADLDKIVDIFQQKSKLTSVL